MIVQRGKGKGEKERKFADLPSSVFSPCQQMGKARYVAMLPLQGEDAAGKAG